MEKKTTNRKSKKEETPQVITTGIEEPVLEKITTLIITQTRGSIIKVSHWYFADENYAKSEMQKDIEKFKQAYLHGTYKVVKEEEDDVVIFIKGIQLRWEILIDGTIEREGKTRLLLPNRYNQTFTSRDDEKQ